MLVEFHSEAISAFKSIKRILGSNISVDILSGFVGQGATQAILRLGLKDVRVVFGLSKPNAKVEPSLYDEIVLLRQIADVRISRGLHAKVYIFNGSIIAVGSANFTKSGFGTHQEALVLTNEAKAVRKARDLFEATWHKGFNTLKIKRGNLRKESASSSNENGGIGYIPQKDKNPFLVQQSKASAIRPVRLCAYPAYWLEKKDSFEYKKTIRWSTGSATQKGDIQIFSVSTDTRKSNLRADDRRVDSIHSIWQATTNCQKVNVHTWPLQARFRLLVRLKNPVCKKELLSTKVLSSTRWPRGSKGKMLYSRENIASLGRLLTAHNPSQRIELFEALQLVKR